MIVSNNTLLNILLPNENQTLKEVLKEADSKSLSSNKSANLSDVIKNLFGNLKTEGKSNETIQNILKNSTVFKNLGNFPKDLEALVKNIPNEPNLQTPKNTLQNSLVNIKNLDENSLKQLVQQSGIFLESKIGQSSNNPSLAKLTDVLQQIKTLIQNDTSPKAKELSGVIDKILTQTSSGKAPDNLQSMIKEAVTLLKDLSSSSQNGNSAKIVNLTNQLESLTKQTQLAESKITTASLPNNDKAALSSDVKTLLTQVKSELTVAKNPAFAPIIKQIDSMLQSSDIFAKNQTTATPKEMLQTIINSPALSQAAKEAPQVNNLTAQLSNQMQNITTIEKGLDKAQINPTQIQQLQTQIKETLTQLQSVLNNVKGVDVKGLNALIDKLTGMTNLFSKLEVPASMQQSVASNTNQGATNATNPTQTQTAQNSATSSTNQTAQNPTQTATSSAQTTQSSPTAQLNQTATPSAQTTQTSTVQSTTPGQSQVQINLNDTTQQTVKVDNSMQNSEQMRDGKLQNAPLSENIKSIINAIKSTISQLQTAQQNPALANDKINAFEIQKSITRLETLISAKGDNIIQQLTQNLKSPTEFLQNDVKSALLQIQQEVANNPRLQDMNSQVDKLLTHIDYYQLLSITSSSNYLYLPFIWDMLEEGNISLKQLKEDHYFCEIHLTLKEFGNMDLLLGLYDENHLDISIFSNKPFVKDLIKEHMVELRVGLNKAGLIPQNIQILDLKEDETADEPTQSYNSNHNPYNSDDLGFGVDIKV